ncbi:hypothetical protein OUZ56_010733 [Daphnia magna]|uniref:Uncharacterized protein n=1 Tax=Daphnia magna TaxID=35525 RepID=A0ABQ9YYK7_9CRUS|nr:hypothetical protein OUZ56_010733 [Daphnia magna]
MILSVAISGIGENSKWKVEGSAWKTVMSDGGPITGARCAQTHRQSSCHYHAHHFTRLTAIGSRKDNPDSELWPQWHYFFVFNRGILSGKQSQGRARDVVCRSLSRVVPVIVTATFHGLTDNLVISKRFWLASQRCPASNYVFSRSAKS